MPAFNRIQWEGKVMDLVLRTGEELEEIYRRHADTVYRVCFSFMKNPADTEDMVQETFLRLLSSGKAFSSREHEKAWLLRTTLNRAGDLCRRRRDDACLDAAESVAAEAPDYGPLLSAVRSLPQAYSAVIHLYYYEGYSIKEIARLLALPVPTVGTRLARGRERLREMLKEDDIP